MAIGAVTADGVRVVNRRIIHDLGVSASYLERTTQRRTQEAQQLTQILRDGLAAAPIKDRIVILCDDGLATGASMLAAVRSVRAQGPKLIVVAVPVGSRDACAMVRQDVDELVCLTTPEPFWAVGVYYADFGQTDNDEVRRLLREAHPDANSPLATSTPA